MGSRLPRERQPHEVRVSNAEIPNVVRNHIAFTNKVGSCYGGWEPNDRLYVVWSYGPHFPALVYEKRLNEWFINDADAVSQTTNQQMRGFRHQFPQAEPRSTDWLQQLIQSGGVKNWVACKLLRATGHDWRHVA
jgi:hypothetical protein